MREQTNWIIKVTAICLLVVCFSQPVAAYLVADGLTWNTLSSARMGDPEPWSYNDVLAGANGFLADGWRYARTSEMDSLFTAFIDPSDPVSGVKFLQDALGLTDSFDSVNTSAFSTIGIFEDRDDTDSQIGEARLEYAINYDLGRNESPTGFSASYSITEDAFSVDDKFGFLGHWLVQDSEASDEPIPEPGTLLLAGISLASFASYGWRHRSRS